jgi:hypothetical protein
VGPTSKQPNTPDDVELVQFLLREFWKRTGVDTVFNDVPALTRKMDVVTAFWLLRFQRALDQVETPDGVVSPAHGAQYSPGKDWTIVDLKGMYNQLFGAEAFARIPINPELSGTLRQQLQQL